MAARDRREECPGDPPGRGSEGEASPESIVRIHRVIGRLNVGGPAMHVVNLARSLDRGRFRTRLVAGTVPEAEGDMEYYARERGVEVTRVPEMSREVRPVADAGALVRLVRLFRRDRPHVVHTHTAKAGALGRVAALLAGVPVRIHTFHGHVLGGGYFGPRRTAFYRTLERQLARISHRVVVLSGEQRRELGEELAVVPPEKLAVVPLGLELDAFVELDRGARRLGVRGALELDDDTPVVGIVGRLVPIKNHELLFRAVASMDRVVTVMVVGGGAREAELRALVDGLGMSERVRWLGWRRDLPDLYAAMDVLALTSRDEGTPVAVIEALVAGTPVVARAVGGVPDVLEGGRLGRLVRSEEPEAFAAALDEALEAPRGPGPEERRRLARAYSVERLADDLAALYLEELDRRGISP